MVTVTSSTSSSSSSSSGQLAGQSRPEGPVLVDPFTGQALASAFIPGGAGSRRPGTGSAVIDERLRRQAEERLTKLTPGKVGSTGAQRFKEQQARAETAERVRLQTVSGQRLAGQQRPSDIQADILPPAVSRAVDFRRRRGPTVTQRITGFIEDIPTEERFRREQESQFFGREIARFEGIPPGQLASEIGRPGIVGQSTEEGVRVIFDPEALRPQARQFAQQQFETLSPSRQLALGIGESVIAESQFGVGVGRGVVGLVGAAGIQTREPEGAPALGPSPFARSEFGEIVSTIEEQPIGERGRRTQLGAAVVTVGAGLAGAGGLIATRGPGALTRTERLIETAGVFSPFPRARGGLFAAEPAITEVISAEQPLGAGRSIVRTLGGGQEGFGVSEISVLRTAAGTEQLGLGRQIISTPAARVTPSGPTFGRAIIESPIGVTGEAGGVGLGPVGRGVAFEAGPGVTGFRSDVASPLGIERQAGLVRGTERFFSGIAGPRRIGRARPGELGIGDVTAFEPTTRFAGVRLSEPSDIGAAVVGRGRRPPRRGRDTFATQAISSLPVTTFRATGVSALEPVRPTIVGGAGARGAFTGTGQFERTDFASFAGPISRQQDIARTTGVTFTPLATSLRPTQTQRGRGAFAIPSAPIAGQFLDVGQRPRLLAATRQAQGLIAPTERTFSPFPTTTGAGFFPRGGFRTPFRGLGGFGALPFLGGEGIPRPRRPGRRARRVQIRPSFTATVLDLRGDLPSEVSIGGLDLGLLPGTIRRIPRGKKKKTTKKKPTKKRKSKKKS